MADGLDPADWKELLARWSEDLLQDPDVLDDLPPEVAGSRWLGYAPATEEEIRRAEARLGMIRLPPTYRAFLQASNGWRTTGAFVFKLWSTEEIEWYRKRHPDLVEAAFEGERLGRELYGGQDISNEDYFVYGDEQDSTTMRVEYLETALEVSDIGDSAVFLLNPRVVTPEGEWEAWFEAPWLPGANRYRSFWELMLAHHQRYLRLRDDPRLHPPGPRPKQIDFAAAPRAVFPSLDKPSGVGGAGDDVHEIPISALQSWAQQALEKMGVPAADATTIVDVLLDSELRGDGDRGVRYLGQLLEAYASGELNPAPNPRDSNPGSEQIFLDGDRGCGVIAAERALEMSLEKARAGFGADAWIFNVGDLVAPAYFALRAANEGMIACVATNVPRLISASSDLPPVLEPYSFACAVPRGRSLPLLIDQRTSAASPVPPATLLASAVTSPYLNAATEPIEGYLATCAMFVQHPMALQPKPGEDAVVAHHLFLANVARRCSLDEFAARVDALIDRTERASGVRAVRSTWPRRWGATTYGARPGVWPEALCPCRIGRGRRWGASLLR